jgi:RES domain-containing protein
MISAWRIVKARHAAAAFDGEGARIAGGRWNSAGLPVVYVAGSAALAALEMLVHLGRSATVPDYVLIGCTFAESLVVVLDRPRLGESWRASPAPARLQQIGDAWLKSGVSAALEVPSAVIPNESNYLLNPRHPSFASLKLSPP